METQKSKDLETLINISQIVYKLPKIEYYYKLTRGFGSEKFVLCCSKDKYVLRVNLPFFSSVNNAKIRAHIINNIKKEIRCPDIFPVEKTFVENHTVASRGNTYFLFNNKLVELYSWIPSEPHESTLDADISLVKFFVEICNAFDKIPLIGKYNKNRGFRSRTTYSDINFLRFKDDKQITNKILAEHDLLKLQRIWDKYYNKIFQAKSELKNNKLVFIHGDLYSSNIGFHKNKARVLYDFESVRQGIRIEDIAWAYADFCGLSEMANSFYEKNNLFKVIFEDNYPSFKYEKEFMLYVLMNRHIRSLYTHLSSISKGGSPPLKIVSDHIKRIIALDKYWKIIMESLYK